MKKSGFVYKGIFVSEKQTDSVADFFRKRRTFILFGGDRERRYSAFCVLCVKQGQSTL